MNSPKGTLTSPPSTTLDSISRIHGTYVHHNYTENCDVFIEMGGDHPGSAVTCTRIAYNASITNGKMFLGSHESTSHFASTFSNTVVENNTMVLLRKDAHG